MFFDFYVTLWGIISPNKRILVKIRLEKVDLGEVYIQKEQENIKKRSSSNTTGGLSHMSHPVIQRAKLCLNEIDYPMRVAFHYLSCRNSSLLSK